MFEYTGKSIEIQYENGNHYKVDYISDNKLRWRSLVERTDGLPLSGDETYYLNQQADNIFTVSWIEETGATVTQNLDFNKMEAYAFVSWNDPSARGGRALLSQHGVITLSK